MKDGHPRGNLHSGVESILILDSPANASRESPIRPGMRLILDPPVGMPDQMPPLPRRMPRGKRIGTDLIDIVAARPLAAGDRPRAFDRAGGVDPFALTTDTEHGCFPLRTDHPAQGRITA
jgi:hypothetical protein